MSLLLQPAVEGGGSRGSLRLPKPSRVPQRALPRKRNPRRDGGEERRRPRKPAMLVLLGVALLLLRTTRRRQNLRRMTKKKLVSNLPKTYHWQKNANVLDLTRNPIGLLLEVQRHRVSRLNAGHQNASAHSLDLFGILPKTIVLAFSLSGRSADTSTPDSFIPDRLFRVIYMLCGSMTGQNALFIFRASVRAN